MKLKLEFRDIGWWYWLASWVLIVSGLAGWEMGFVLVTLLAAWQIAHYGEAEKSFKSFSVQVRIGFFFLALAGLWEPLRFIYWLPAFGLAARLVFNYCFLARMMSLLPWNRKEPLTLALFRRRIFSPPIDGSVLEMR